MSASTGPTLPHAQALLAGAFSLTPARTGDVQFLVVSGELDIASAPNFETVLRRLEAGDARFIVVDLTNLQFIDSTGIRMFMEAEERSRRTGRRLRMLRPAPRVWRTLEICSVTDFLPFVD